VAPALQPHALKLTRTPAAGPCRLQVLIWNEKTAGVWDQKLLHDFQGPVWRVSWSVTGSILAVTDSSNAVTLWKETLDGKWQQLSQ
jgi:protein transport protein SEC13